MAQMISHNFLSNNAPLFIHYLLFMATLIQIALSNPKVSLPYQNKIKSELRAFEEVILQKVKLSLDDHIILKRLTFQPTFMHLILTYEGFQYLPKMTFTLKVDFDNKINGKIYFQVNQLYKNAKTPSLNLFLLKYLVMLNIFVGNNYKFVLYPDNGFIFAKLNIFTSSNLITVLEVVIREAKMMRYYISKIYILTMKLVNEIGDNYMFLVNERLGIFSEETKKEKERVQNIDEYLNLCSNSLQKNLMKKEKREIMEKMNNQSISFKESSKNLYFLFQQKSSGKITLEYYKNLYENYLQLPQIKPKYPENPFLFNYINILNNGFQSKDLNIKSGRNKILLTQLKYVYTNKQASSKPTPPLIKPIAIKIPRSANPNSSQIMKINHEKQIVKLLKQAQSMFLPKYYQFTNTNVNLKNALLMDFLFQYDCLNDFIRRKRDSLSVFTLTFILVNIMESLRLISKQDIVHMDLSMKNILIRNNFQIKLIDFGESYHKDVSTSKKIQHGFTLPYTCPERFSNHNYSPKSDIYSYGVIFWKIFFHASPFSLNEKNLMQHLKSGSYQNKIRIIPESLSYTGNEQMMGFILKLLLLCLSEEKERRPDPSWSLIILKTFFSWVEDTYIVHE